MHKQESIYVDGDKCFVVAIENVKVMQNVEIHGLKTIRTLTFVQEPGHFSINNLLTLYLQHQKSKRVDITVNKSPKKTPGVHFHN